MKNVEDETGNDEDNSNTAIAKYDQGYSIDIIKHTQNVETLQEK